MKSLIKEIGGLATTLPTGGSTVGKTIGQMISGRLTSNVQNILPLCSRMEIWQQTILKGLARGIDQYIAASPGAGKTLPYMCYWVSHILGLDYTGAIQSKNEAIKFANRIINEPDRIPKTLILVPIRSLAQQTYQEFREIFSQIVGSILVNLLLGLVDRGKQGRTPPGPKQAVIILPLDPDVETLLASVSPDLRRYMNQRKQDLQRYYQLKNQGRFEDAKQYESGISQIDNNIRQLIVDGITNIVSSQRSSYGLIAIRTGLGTEGNPKMAPVTIAIYESAPKVVDEIGSKIELLVCDESHLIQRKDQISQDGNRAYNIAGSLYKVLSQLKNVSYRLLFLSGTANPNSAENLAKYINMCFRRNVKVVIPPSSAGNRSAVNIVADDSIQDDRSLINIIKKGQGGNVIVVFSKRKINDLARQAIKQLGSKSLQSVQQGTYKKYEYKPVLRNLPKFTGGASRDPNLDPIALGKMSASQGLEASGIHDQLLRQAVQAGFGYIYRLDERDKDFNMRKKDNEIVADLFSKGKIKTLLSTDAIGVGVNIKVRNLIIPSIDKPTGGGMRESMDPANLAQLLHRAGRGAFVYATVVTPDKNVAKVSHALSLSPEGFTKGVTIQNFPAGACRLSNFFADLWSAL